MLSFYNNKMHHRRLLLYYLEFQCFLHYHSFSSPIFSVIFDTFLSYELHYDGDVTEGSVTFDSTTGKPLNKTQIAELTQLLKPGHEKSSIQKGDSLRTKNLVPEITLKDGTKVILADTQEIENRVAQMKTKDGGKNMTLDNQRIIVTDCNGNFVRSINR